MKALLSPKLKELASFFEKRRDADTKLTAKSSALLAEQLTIIVAIAQAMETELNAFRLLEANRAGRKFMEEEAAETLKSPVASDGNVVRPVFGRKS